MFTAKKRTSENICAPFLIPVILFSVLIPISGPERVSAGGNDRIKILILSKHLRLLEQGETDSLDIILPEDGDFDTGTDRFPLRTLSIVHKNSFTIGTGKSFFGTGNYRVYPGSGNGTFSVIINGEKRQYPLPLYIKNSGKDIELSVEENVNRYAIDSAVAELGEVQEKHSEALFALAHLIKARCSLPRITNKHSGYHFCDLTCCQTYKGRTGRTYDDTVSIKTGDLKNGLFFHASSGGMLFTESVFNSKQRRSVPPKDVIFSENLVLSSKKYFRWSTEIAESELSDILYPGENIFFKSMFFDRGKETVMIRTGTGERIISPESLRIKVNRVKGWNFLRSNNYTVTKKNSNYFFTGSGLGHGVGMSFEGALQLAEKGYSRYEILEHYYPGLKYTQAADGHNPEFQYIIFNTGNGEILQSNAGTSFKNRIVPCGSLFKLFIALYLAEKRKDIFYNYYYVCPERDNGGVMPSHCWNMTGHGKMNISSALYHSCNMYFASLYRSIDRDDFAGWIKTFASENGITLAMPEIKDSMNFSKILPGLDFNITITIEGIMKLNRYIYAKCNSVQSDRMDIIFNALQRTFREGTAGKDKKWNILKKENQNRDIKEDKLWGKTGTIIAGTNSHFGYGLFTGGLGPTGVVALLRKGTGAMAAGEAAEILLNMKHFSEKDFDKNR